MHQNSISSEDSQISEDRSDELNTIRQIARHYGVTLRALRFYEDRGLLKPHRIGATRLYDEATRTRLEKILEGKRLGFTLTEISSMLGESKGFRLELDPEQVRNQIDLLERQRAGLDRAIEELKTVHAKISESSGVASAA